MNMKSIATAALAVAAAVQLHTAAAQQPPPARQLRPVTEAMLQNPDPGDWLSWRRTRNHWAYSPLDQVSKRNVAQLRLVRTRPLGQGVQEGTPLVHDGVMFFPNPSDLTQAIDGVTGDLIWEYRRTYPEDLGDYIPFPAINRNLAIFGNFIFDNGNDQYAYALDARTGKLAWETKILDYKHGAQHTSGPIVAKGKVISGRGCEPEGGPEACVITAFDAQTGKELWRTRTIPKPGEPGNETWGNIPYEERRHVGTWMVPSYDPDLNRIYIGTSVTSPAPKFMLAGNDKQYLYHNSTLALDADTGKIVWYLQHLVDNWDFDHPFERMIVDTVVAPDPKAVKWINPRVRTGQNYKVITGIPGKTGIVYTIDRETGQFLWARPTVEQNVVESVNTESGFGNVAKEKMFTAPNQEIFVCPSFQGGKNFHAGAYSPLTKLMYFPLQNTCTTMTSIAAKPSLDELYAIRTKDQITPGTQNVGTIEAISVETGKTAWKREQRAGQTSLMVTAGGLLFGGDTNGHFRAFDPETGAVLWDVNLGSQIAGYPATYAVNGKQYIAVSTGGSLNTFGLASLTPDQRAGAQNALYVFALP